MTPDVPPPPPFHSLAAVPWDQQLHPSTDRRGGDREEGVLIEPLVDRTTSRTEPRGRKGPELTGRARPTASKPPCCLLRDGLSPL